MKINWNYRFYEKSSFVKLNRVFLDAILFILLSAFNGLVPICICLIGASFKPFGTQLTMAIGYLTAIQLGFVQLSWTVCLAAIFAHNRYQKNNIDSKQMETNLVSTTLALSLLYGLIITPFFIGISYAYNNYASAHINTLLGQAQANNYIWAISGYILLSGFVHSGIILIQKYKSNLLAILLLFLFVGLSLGISAALTLGTTDYFVITKILQPANPTTGAQAITTLEISGSYQGLFLGLGFTIASVLMLPIIYFCLVEFTNFKLKNLFIKNNIGYFLKRTYSPLIVILTIQIIKAIMIIAIGLTLTDSVEQVVPVSYQLSRNIWYNLLYILPFFAYGIADATLYYGANVGYTNKEDFKKILWIGVILIVIVQVPFMIGMYFAIEPLSLFYLKNNLENGLPWGMDTSKVSIKYTLESLLKKQEYVDKIKVISSSTQAVAGLLIKFGFSQQQAAAIAPILTPALKGLVSENPEVQTKSIDFIVEILSKNPKKLAQVQRAFAGFLNNGKATSVFKMYDVTQNSNAYIYICVWCLTYPIGQMFNYATINLKNSFNNWIKVIIIFLLQSAIISFIVAFGIEMQYTKEFPMYDAWSLPLVIFGPIALAYFYTNFLIQSKKINS